MLASAAEQMCVCGSAYLQEGREGANRGALTGYVFSFLADSACKGDEWLQFRLRVTKST